MSEEKKICPLMLIARGLFYMDKFICIEEKCMAWGRVGEKEIPHSGEDRVEVVRHEPFYGCKLIEK